MPQQEVRADLPAYLSISATPLMTTWDEVPLRVFTTRKSEFEAMTVGTDDIDYLTLYLPRSILEKGSNEAYNWVNPNQLPCLLIEDMDYSFLIPIPNKGEPRDIEEQIRELMRNLATAAKHASSAREVETILQEQILVHPLPSPPKQNLFEDLIMGNTKLTLIIACLLFLVFLGMFGIPIARAMYLIEPGYLLGFVFLLILYAVLVFFGKGIRDTLQGPVTYLIYMVAAGASSYLLYKILNSTGVFKGALWGAQFEFGGAAAFFAFMMYLGYYFDKARSVNEFAVTFYLHDGSEAGPLISNTGTFQLQINELKIVPVQHGCAAVGRVPASWNGKEAGASVSVNGFTLQGTGRVTLSPDGIYHLVLTKT